MSIVGVGVRTVLRSLSGVRTTLRDWPLVAAVCAVLALSGFAITSGLERPQVPGLERTVTPPLEVRPALAIASDSRGDQILVWAGQDRHVWYSIEVPPGNPFSAPQAVAMAGHLGSVPAVVAVPAGSAASEIWVFWRGVGGALYAMSGILTSDEAAPRVRWSPPYAVAGVSGLDSQPAATYVGAGSATGVWIFWRGRHATLWSVRASLSHAGELHWPLRTQIVPNTGNVGSAPCAGSDASGRIDVYWRGAGSEVQGLSRGVVGWSSAPIHLSFTGKIGSAPSLAVSRSGKQYLVWEGMNAQLWYAESTASGWLDDTAGSPGDGPLGSQPVATVAVGTSSASAAVYVYWKGEDLNIWTTSSPISAPDWRQDSWVEHRP